MATAKKAAKKIIQRSKKSAPKKIIKKTTVKKELVVPDQVTIPSQLVQPNPTTQAEKPTKKASRKKRTVVKEKPLINSIVDVIAGLFLQLSDSEQISVIKKLSKKTPSLQNLLSGEEIFSRHVFAYLRKHLPK